MSEHILDDLRSTEAADSSAVESAKAFIASEYKKCGRRSFSLREYDSLGNTASAAVAVMRALVASGDASFEFVLNTERGRCEWGANDLCALLSSVDDGTIGLSDEPEDYTEFLLYGRRVYLDVRIVISQSFCAALKAKNTGWKLISATPEPNAFATRRYVDMRQPDWAIEDECRPLFRMSLRRGTYNAGLFVVIGEYCYGPGRDWESGLVPVALIGDLQEMLSDLVRSEQ